MSSDPNATNPAPASCCTTEEIMAELRPQIAGKMGAAPGSPDGAQVGGPIADAFVLALENILPPLINFLLSKFHVTKK